MNDIQVTRSRLDRKYHASIGGAFERTGATKTEAYEACIAAVVEQSRHTGPKYFRANDGTLFCLYYADCWCYDILRPGTTTGTTCILGSTSYLDARKWVQNHVEQWNESCRSA